MNRRAAIPLLAGLVIGLVAVKLVMNFVKKAQGSQQAQQKFTLIQAKQDIKAYEKIDPEMVQAVETSDSVLAPQAERMGSLESVVGRVAMKGIPQNAPILKSMLAPEGTPEGIEGRIPAGYRAVAVKIDEATSAGYNLQPGDWVDVIVVMDIETGARGKKDTLAEVILQRVQIAAIGQGTNEQADAAGGGKVKPAKSATILVKHEDAPKLHLAGTRGKITLVLRGSDDKNDDAPATAYGNDIMNRLLGDRVAAANPAPTPEPAPVVEPVAPLPPPHTVMVFRSIAQGTKPAATERVTFEHAESWKLVDVGSGTPTGAGAIIKGTRPGRTPVAAPKPVSKVLPEPQPINEDVKNGNEANEEYDADEE